MGVHARPRHRALLGIVEVGTAAMRRDVPTAVLAVNLMATATRAPPVTLEETASASSGPEMILSRMIIITRTLG